MVHHETLVRFFQTIRIFSKNQPSWLILSISQNVRLCVFLYVCPSHFSTLFNGLFAPTFRSPMSKLFRFSESFGKSNGRKGSQIWQFLFIKGVESLRQKKSFSRWFFSFICLLHLNVFFPLLPKVWFANFLDFWNPWGTVMERSSLRF